MIRGTGIDVVDVSRIDRAIRRHADRFLGRVFTAEERRLCDARPVPAQSYAARFAAKEAAVKALSGATGIRWRDLEILRGTRGAPRLTVHGAAAEIARSRGVETFHVSLAHDGGVAVAVVIAESSA